MARKTLTGLQKVAAFMITLGPEVSAQLMKQLPQEEIERISSEIANMSAVDPDTKKMVVEEFLQLTEAQQYLLRGGIKYAREVLEKSVGPQRTSEIIKRLTEHSKIRPFSFIRKADPKQLLNYIMGEHPQTIALILCYLDPEQAAIILSALPDEMQTDVARRVAIMERTSPDILREVESILERKLASLVNQDFASAGGIKTLVDILNRADRGTEKTIIESLEEHDVELAEEVRKRLFVFEDIINLDDNAIRRVLRDVDNRDLSLALKGSSEEVMARILRNLSKRAAEMLREDIEILGPTRLRDVEDSQQRIVQVIRRLDEAGEVFISRGGEDAIIV